MNRPECPNGAGGRTDLVLGSYTDWRRRRSFTHRTLKAPRESSSDPTPPLAAAFPPRRWRRPGMLWARAQIVVVLLLITVPTAEAIANCCVGGFFSLAVMELIACAVCLGLSIMLCRLTSRLYAAREQDEQRLKQIEDADAALRASGERFRLLSQLAPVGIFQTDDRGETVFVNDEYRRLTGRGLDECRAGGWVRALHPEDRDRVVASWHQAFATEADFSAEYRYQRPDGQTVWVSGLATPMRDRTGRVTGYLGAVANITALKAAESRLRESLAHQQSLARREQTLRRELDHRVRNNLAGLLGLIRLYRRAGDPRGSLVQIEGKVRAIREVHELLAAPPPGKAQACDGPAGGEWGRFGDGHVELGTLIRRLTTLVAEPAALARIDLPEVEDEHIWIPAAQATPLSMIMHELLTNSSKHGALAPGIGGRVRISWVAAPDGSGFRLDWHERCDRSIGPAGEGLGLGLIRGFARSELGGDCTIDLDDRGLEFELRAGVRVERTQTRVDPVHNGHAARTEPISLGRRP